MYRTNYPVEIRDIWSKIYIYRTTATRVIKMDRLLYIGCAPGNDVVAVQVDLNKVQDTAGQESAYIPLNPDGIFGAATHNRVMEFQRINTLTSDGIVGAATREKLQTLLAMQLVTGQGLTRGVTLGTVGKKSYLTPKTESSTPVINSDLLNKIR